MIGFLSSALFFVFVVRLEDAMPGFILLLTWLSIGSILYVYTQEKHKMHWRIQKQQRKEKEREDKKLIREIIGSAEEKNK